MGQNTAIHKRGIRSGFPKKKTVRDGMVRWISLILAPYILLLLLLNGVAFVTSTARVRESQENTLRLQAYDIDDQLNTVANTLLRIGGDNYYDLLVLRHRFGEMETYLSRQELYNQLYSYALSSLAQDFLFLYSPAMDHFLIGAPDLSYTEKENAGNFLREYLQGTISEESPHWYTKEIGGTYYMVYFLQIYGLWLGGAIKVDALLSDIFQDQPHFLEDYRLYLETASGLYKLNGKGFSQQDPGSLKNAWISVQGPSGSFTLRLEIRNAFFLFSQASYIAAVVVCSLLMIALLPFWFQRVSRKITQPLHDLDQGMRLLQKGNFETKLEAHYEFLEMEGIKDTFNTMTQRIKLLKSDIYEEKLLRQKTEFDFLQIQVKPHFYLNCLNQIHILAEMGDVEAVSELSQRLVRYFRYLLRTDTSLVPLQDELNHIDDYLYIQTMRYPAGFQYSCTVDPAAQTLKIPPLLLLTFVENSVKYALSIYGESRLSIQVEKLGNTCRILIDDNGKGLPPEMLEALRKENATELYSPEGRKCIGVINARQRLRYAFNDKAQLTLSNNSPWGGCRVSIVIPWEENLYEP